MTDIDSDPEIMDEINSVQAQQYEEEPVLDVVVVENVPVVDDKKYEKLLAVLKKIFSQLGEVKDIRMPKGDGDKTKGFALVTYDSEKSAKLAANKLNNYAMDKNHTFKVYPLETVGDAVTPTDKHAVEPIPYIEKGFLSEWCTDKRGRDQFVLRAGAETEICWLEVIQKPQMVYGRANWTEHVVQWSPRGSYLVTFNEDSVGLWGRSDFSLVLKLDHPGTSKADFSPCERFLVTWSPELECRPDNPQNVIVWDLRSKQRIRALVNPPREAEVPWPFFKWSHDGQYVCRKGDGAIFIYGMPSMVPLKRIVADGVKDMEWSPADNYLAYWQPELGNNPARVTVVEISGSTTQDVSEAKIGTKNVFNVVSMQLNWHKRGDFLAVRTERTPKSKKPRSDIYIFRVRDKNVPVELLELTSNVISLSWEPVGQRFVVVHGDGPKPDVNFYSMKKGKDNKLQVLKKLEKASVTTVAWSPAGENVVLANLKAGGEGELDFYNVSKQTDEVKLMGRAEHYLCTQLSWDPSGRYVATYVSALTDSHENEYRIYSFSGKLLQKRAVSRLFQFLWRPRPPSLLKDKDLKEIKGKLRDAGKRYDAEDDRLKAAVALGDEEKRAKWNKEWQDWVVRWKTDHKNEKKLREEVRGRPEFDPDDYEEAEVEVEEILEEDVSLDE